MGKSAGQGGVRARTVAEVVSHQRRGGNGFRRVAPFKPDFVDGFEHGAQAVYFVHFLFDLCAITCANTAFEQVAIDSRRCRCLSNIDATGVDQRVVGDRDQP